MSCDASVLVVGSWSSAWVWRIDIASDEDAAESAHNSARRKSSSEAWVYDSESFDPGVDSDPGEDTQPVPCSVLNGWV